MGELRMARCIGREQTIVFFSFIFVYLQNSFLIVIYTRISIYDLWAVWSRGRPRFEYHFRKFRILHTDEHVSETCSYPKIQNHTRVKRIHSLRRCDRCNTAKLHLRNVRNEIQVYRTRPAAPLIRPLNT